MEENFSFQDIKFKYFRPKEDSVERDVFIILGQYGSQQGAEVA